MIRTFYEGTTVADTQALYILVTPSGREFRLSRHDAARTILDGGLPTGFHVEKRYSTKEVPACPWCGVRPLVFELDCDGWASTGSCQSPQCNRLRRCDGCGTDGTVRYGSVRGRLCEGCHERATREDLVAAVDRYELVPAIW